MKSNLWRVGGGVAVVLGAVVLSVMVQAHAKLEKTAPKDKAVLVAPPPNLELWFDETPDVKTSKIELKGAAGAVKLGPVHSMSPKTLMADVAGNMPDGAYTASWQTAGDDGHVQKGTFAFTVKRATK